MEQQYQHLLVETNSVGVCTITLNRPEKLNAVNEVLSEELPKVFGQVSLDDQIKVVVVTGAGRGFCAGLDLDPKAMAERMASMKLNRAVQLDDLRWVGRLALAIVNCDKPVIAAINGAAAGAGFGLALAADIRLMRSDAVVTTGYLRRGLSPDAGVSYFLPRLVGTSRATELIMTARNINADEAERIGLVSRVLSPEDFTTEIATYAADLASGPPIALTLTKRLLAASPNADLTTQLKSELAFINKCFATEDVGEAVRAFAEKRKPNFKGR